MEIEIRPARENDIPELARLVAAIAAYHESIDPRARFDWDDHAIWVADHGDGRLAGYLWIHLKRDRQGFLPRVKGYVNHAFLDEASRGKGLMKRMLALAYEWFRSKGITVVTLTVLHRNWLGSTAWYKHGFEDFIHERRIEISPEAVKRQ
jgi:GNAT superfamily N-acetyltransferase